jgi:hypothetical protein
MPSEANGGETTKNSVFLRRTNGSKRALMSKSQMKITLITFFDIKGIFSLRIHSARPNSQPIILHGNTEAVTCSCA